MTTSFGASSVGRAGRSARRGGAAGDERQGQQHHPDLADDLAGQEVQRAEGEPQEDDRVRRPGRPCSTPSPPAPGGGAQRRVDGEIGEFRQQEGGRRGDHQRGRRHAAEITAPTRIAPTPTATPSRRCTRSRSTSAAPTISTPDGAIRPGATGIRQGPFGTQTVPTWPISQLAAGMVRQNRTRKTAPSIILRFSLSNWSFFSSSRHEFRIAVCPQFAGRALPQP